MKTIFIYVCLMILDFITGMLRSAKNSKKPLSFDWLSSDKAIKGFIKKSIVLLTCLGFWLIDKTGFVNVELYPLLLAYGCITEVTSVLENMRKTNSDYKNFTGGDLDERIGTSNKKDKKEGKKANQKV